MQPDPIDFLAGARRELLAALNPAAGVSEATQGMTLARVAETLAHLAVRQEALPAILAGVRPRLQSLLGQTIDLLEAQGITTPSNAREMSRLSDAALAGEECIAVHDRITLSLIDSLRLLPSDLKQLDSLIAEASEIESHILIERGKALEDFRTRQRETVLPDDSVLPSDDEVTQYLRAQLPEMPRIRAHHIKQQKGVNTKEIFSLQLDDAGDWPSEAILRRNRPFDSVGNCVNEEFSLLSALHSAGVPVPRPLIADGPTSLLHRPFILMEKAAGKPESLDSLGSGAPPIMRDLACALGKLHAVRPEQLASRRQTYGVGATPRTLAMVDRFEAMWNLERNQQWASLGAAYAWLRAHVDVVGDQTVLVHGDFDLRNVLIANGSVSAVLDWELAHEGHPAEDLAYCQPQVEKVIPWTEFYKIYLDNGGVEVRDEEIAYFRIYSDVFRVSTVYPATNAYLTGRHGDFLIGSVGFLEHDEVMKSLADLLSAANTSRKDEPVALVSNG